MTDKKQDAIKPSFWSILGSTIAAAFGVQNKKNLERDFSQSSPLPFIVAGILFTVVFVFSLIFIVKLIV